MAEWNYSSVNTIRLPIFINNNGFYILKLFIRVGRKGAVVYNSNNSGIFAVIDENTGVIQTNGYNLNGRSFIKHLDPGVLFKGSLIPKWEELVALAQDIHKTIPNYPYIGWGFALTNNGWVLIEGNWGQFMSEFADKEGIKEKFNSLFD